MSWSSKKNEALHNAEAAVEALQGLGYSYARCQEYASAVFVYLNDGKGGRFRIGYDQPDVVNWEDNIPDQVKRELEEEVGIEF